MGKALSGKQLTNLAISLRNGEDGQDVVEYTLLLAFITITSAALFLHGSESIAAIWTTTGSNLEEAQAAAAS